MSDLKLFMVVLLCVTGLFALMVSPMLVPIAYVNIMYCVSLSIIGSIILFALSKLNKQL